MLYLSHYKNLIKTINYIFDERDLLVSAFSQSILIFILLSSLFIYNLKYGFNDLLISLKFCFKMLSFLQMVEYPIIISIVWIYENLLPYWVTLLVFLISLIQLVLLFITISLKNIILLSKVLSMTSLLKKVWKAFLFSKISIRYLLALF